MTIAFDARPLKPQTRHWGPGVFVSNIVSRLSSEFHFVGVAPRFLPVSGIEISSWPALPKTGALFYEFSPLLAGPFDIFWGSIGFLPANLRKPSVVTVHDLMFINGMDQERGAGFMSWRLRSSLHRARKIVTVSKTTANDLVERFPECGSKVVPVLNGFEISDDEVPQRDRREETPYVLMLGAHHPRKNLRLAVLAVWRLQKSGVNVRLVLTGDVHNSFAPLLIEFSGTVVATGVLPRSDTFRLLRDAVALMFPSQYEGFGFPILEAMACGCPVLALDTPINREVGGEAAWLLQEDPFAWAEAIRHLLESPPLRQEISIKGSSNLARFSWETAATAYLEIFREAAK